MTTTAPLSLPTSPYGGLGLGIMTGQEVASAVGPASAKAPAGGAAKSASKQPRGKKDDEANYTTIMLRNIPNKYSRQMLIDQLHNMGFLGQIDYLYLPIDFANRCNVGYCFINFRTAHARAKFNSMFDNVPAQQCLPGFNSYKVCQVTKAKWQGRDENVRRIRSGPELMQQLAGHPDWLPVLLDEQGNQEPFLTDEIPGAKQTAQKGRNNKKQILTPGQLRPGGAQVAISELLEGGTGAGRGAGKKSGNPKAAAGPGKGGKNAGGKGRGAKAGGADMAQTMAGMPQLAQYHYQMQMLQAMAACNPMGGCGCGMPMSMMPGGVPMQGFPIMQPMTPGYEGMDSAALMNMSMMPFAGGIDMSQYATAMQMAAFPAFSAESYDVAQGGDPRSLPQMEVGEGDDEDGEEDDD